MSAPAVMGVDPGTKGAAVVLDGVGRVLGAWAFKPKMTHSDAIWRVIVPAMSCLKAAGSNVVYIEHVGVMPRDGKKGAFTFGKGDGLTRGAMHLYFGPDWKPFEVLPMAWQASLECLSGGNKNLLKRKAEELWPARKWTLATCDAALIAEYGRRRLL